MTLIILSLTLIYYHYQKNRYESKVQELFLKNGISCNNILASTSQGIVFDSKIICDKLKKFNIQSKKRIAIENYYYSESKPDDLLFVNLDHTLFQYSPDNLVCKTKEWHSYYHGKVTAERNKVMWANPQKRKSIISKIHSLNDAVETPKAPELPKAVQLNEDAQLRVLAGTSSYVSEAKKAKEEE